MDHIVQTTAGGSWKDNPPTGGRPVRRVLPCHHPAVARHIVLVCDATCLAWASTGRQHARSQQTSAVVRCSSNYTGMVGPYLGFGDVLDFGSLPRSQLRLGRTSSSSASVNRWNFRVFMVSPCEQQTGSSSAKCETQSRFLVSTTSFLPALPIVRCVCLLATPSVSARS